MNHASSTAEQHKALAAGVAELRYTLEEQNTRINKLEDTNKKLSQQIWNLHQQISSLQADNGRK